MAKRRMRRYPKAFTQLAVARLNQDENCVALSQEFGGATTIVYVAQEPDLVQESQETPATAGSRRLRKEVSQLKHLSAERMEMDFPQWALRTVEADASKAVHLEGQHLHRHPRRRYRGQTS